MRKKRTLGVLAATLVAAALPVVAASPASATSGQCQVFLRSQGYVVGPKVKAACDLAANLDVPGGGMVCYWHLTDLGVRTYVAEQACFGFA